MKNKILYTNEFKNWSFDTAGALYSKQCNGAKAAQLVQVELTCSLPKGRIHDLQVVTFPGF